MEALKCPYCDNDDADLIEEVGLLLYLCGVCSKVFKVRP